MTASKIYYGNKLIDHGVGLEMATCVISFVLRLQLNFFLNMSTYARMCLICT